MSQTSPQISKILQVSKWNSSDFLRNIEQFLGKCAYINTFRIVLVTINLDFIPSATFSMYRIKFYCKWSVPHCHIGTDVCDVWSLLHGFVYPYFGGFVHCILHPLMYRCAYTQPCTAYKHLKHTKYAYTVPFGSIITITYSFANAAVWYTSFTKTSNEFCCYIKDFVYIFVFFSRILS